MPPPFYASKYYIWRFVKVVLMAIENGKNVRKRCSLNEGVPLPCQFPYQGGLSVMSFQGRCYGSLGDAIAVQQL